MIYGPTPAAPGIPRNDAERMEDARHAEINEARRMARSRGEPFSAYTPSGGHPATPEQLAQEAGDIAREARRDQRRAELVRAFSDLHHDISTEARAPRVPRRTNPHD